MVNVVVTVVAPFVTCGRAGVKAGSPSPDAGPQSTQRAIDAQNFDLIVLFYFFTASVRLFSRTGSLE